MWNLTTTYPIGDHGMTNSHDRHDIPWSPNIPWSPTCTLFKAPRRTTCWPPNNTARVSLSSDPASTGDRDIDRDTRLAVFIVDTRPTSQTRRHKRHILILASISRFIRINSQGQCSRFTRACVAKYEISYKARSSWMIFTYVTNMGAL